MPPDAVAQAATHPALSVNMGPQTNVNSINFTLRRAGARRW